MRKQTYGEPSKGVVITLGCLLAVAVLAIIPTLVMLAWNLVLVPVFDIGTIGFWQAVLLTIVISIFTGGTKVTKVRPLK